MRLRAEAVDRSEYGGKVISASKPRLLSRSNPRNLIIFVAVLVALSFLVGYYVGFGARGEAVERYRRDGNDHAERTLRVMDEVEEKDALIEEHRVQIAHLQQKVKQQQEQQQQAKQPPTLVEAPPPAAHKSDASEPRTSNDIAPPSPAPEDPGMSLEGPGKPWTAPEVVSEKIKDDTEFCTAVQQHNVNSAAPLYDMEIVENGTALQQGFWRRKDCVGPHCIIGSKGLRAKLPRPPQPPPSGNQSSTMVHSWVTCDSTWASAETDDFKVVLFEMVIERPKDGAYRINGLVQALPGNFVGHGNHFKRDAQAFQNWWQEGIQCKISVVGSDRTFTVPNNTWTVNADNQMQDIPFGNNVFCNLPNELKEYLQDVENSTLTRVPRLEVVLDHKDAALKVPLCRQSMVRRQATLCSSSIFEFQPRHIVDWIEYHRILGIDHAVIFDKFGQLSGPLHPLVEEGIVTTVDWPDHHKIKDCCMYFDQQGILNKCMMRFHEATDWVVVVDPDEFVHFSDSNLRERFNNSVVAWAEHLGSEVGEVNFNSIFFGGIENVTADLWVERYGTRSEDCEEIGRTKYMARADIQGTELDVHYTTKRSGTKFQAPCGEVRVNHHPDWVDDVIRPDTEKPGEWDKSARWLLPELRKRLDRWQSVVPVIPMPWELDHRKEEPLKGGDTNDSRHPAWQRCGAECKPLAWDDDRIHKCPDVMAKAGAKNEAEKGEGKAQAPAAQIAVPSTPPGIGKGTVAPPPVAAPPPAQSGSGKL